MAAKKDYTNHKNPFDMSRDEWIEYERAGKSLRDFEDTDLRVSRARARGVFRRNTTQSSDESTPL